ncbi:MAG TPA: type II toxin-antitoxin system HicB family antitoxin [bacterium]|nr:type II toxin-antitoxin system HicB family antitoxin [bacterium]
MKKSLVAYIERDPDTQLLIGEVPGIPGAHTQAESMDELIANLKEVLELCLEEQKKSRIKIPQFVGVQEIEVSI